MQFYKILRADRMPAHGGSDQWPPIGRWRHVEGQLRPCKHGLHVVTADYIAAWFCGDAHIYEVDVKGQQIEHDNKVVVSSARLSRLVGVWTKEMSMLFARDCAVRALRAANIDKEIVDKLARARKSSSIQEAANSANSAALSAVYWAADSANSADSAAYWAADSAADSAYSAYLAADSAAYSAHLAARSTARSAAFSAYSAALSAERRWQGQRILYYLEK